MNNGCNVCSFDQVAVVFRTAGFWCAPGDGSVQEVGTVDFVLCQVEVVPGARRLSAQTSRPGLRLQRPRRRAHHHRRRRRRIHCRRISSFISIHLILTLFFFALKNPILTKN